MLRPSIFSSVWFSELEIGDVLDVFDELTEDDVSAVETGAVYVVVDDEVSVLVSDELSVLDDDDVELEVDVVEDDELDELELNELEVLEVDEIELDELVPDELVLDKLDELSETAPDISLLL